MKKGPISLRTILCSIGILGALLAILVYTISANSPTHAAGLRQAPASESAPAAHIHASLTPHIIHPQNKVKASAVSANLSGPVLPCIGLAKPPLCYSPQQIRKAYSIQPLLNQGITGKGQTIVIVDDYQSPTLVSDLKLFDKIFGLNDPKLNIIAPQGLKPFDPTDPNATGFADEISLDVEWSHVVAPNATIDLVLGNPKDSTLRGQIDALIAASTSAVNQNLGGVMSLSVGTGETCYSTAEINKWHQTFVNAQKKGISVLVSSGDSGAAEVQCDNTGTPIQNVQGASYPASDPLVTAVGGTSLLADKTGQYKSETVWDDEQAGIGSGGGFSGIFPRPDYQNGVPGIAANRGVPDVAYNADPNTGVPVVTSSSGTTMIAIFGGTSAGAPQWAGIAALGGQWNGGRLGFLNPFLYQIGKSNSYTTAFHDVTKGNNTVIGQDANGNPITIQGFNAKKGWDASTGWGTPIASSLVSLLIKAGA